MDIDSQGLRFSLRVPMASWSESGAALRPTDLVPTWSAIVGLMGAGLGLRRADGRLSRLANDYAMAVQIMSAGERLQDYHTVQSPERSQSDRLRARTRADELSVDQIHTTITRREYVTGGAYAFLVLALTAEPVIAPAAIVAALRSPVFPLYAGRRSCPIGRVAAELVSGDLDALLPNATHWDARLQTAKVAALIRERRDMRGEGMSYLTRHECVGTA